MFFLAQPEASNFEFKSPTNMALLERLLMVSKGLRFGFPLGQQMVANIRFWVLDRSMSITLLIMILKSMLRYSLLMTGPCFTVKATPPLAPVERSFLIVS